MAPRGEVELAITFGPAATSTLDVAARYARRHADSFKRMGPRTYRATFRLGKEELRYGRAQDLVAMVHGWRATLIEVDHSPQPVRLVWWMLQCGRGWAQAEGTCRQIFGGRPFPRCRCCPLYDPEWALESVTRPSWAYGQEPTGLSVPDHVPEDWA